MTRAQSIAQTNENNTLWKGDTVGYAALHDWVRRHKLKAKLCELCLSVPPRDLANLSGRYNRDINDFRWLCRKCHMASDNRLGALVTRNKSKRLRDHHCLQCGNSYKPKRLTSKWCSKSCSLIWRWRNGKQPHGEPCIARRKK